MPSQIDDAPWLTILFQPPKIPATGEKFGVSPSYIIDDHVPLNTVAGIPTIDIIDFDFDYWHTPGDTLDKISAESLEITGKTTLLLVEKYLLGQ